MTDHTTEKAQTFPCCDHCVPEQDSGACWAIEVGHGCSCLDCPRVNPPGKRSE